MRQRYRLAVFGMGDVGVLASCRPDTALPRHLIAPHAWVERVGADAATAQLAAALVWCAALWLGVGLLCAAAGALPGAAGRLAAAIARVVLPGAVYRLAAGATGLGLLLAPAVAEAAPAPTVVAPAWPSDAPLPAPAWPTASARGRDTPAAPPAPAPDPAAGTPPARKTPTAFPTAFPRAVTVRAGDSLWTITAARLGPHAAANRVAATWPRWFAANRAVVGDDPDHLVPGQVLHAPTERNTA